MTDKILSLRMTDRNSFASCFYCGQPSEAIAIYRNLDEARVCVFCAKLRGKWTKNRRIGSLSKNKAHSKKNSSNLHVQESQNATINDFSTLEVGK
jgi:hypothetical protein